MSAYIKISDVMKIYKSLYNGYGTTASFNVPVFVDLLRTVAVEFPEPPEVEELRKERDELQKELARYKWISIKDRLPETEGEEIDEYTSPGTSY